LPELFVDTSGWGNLVDASQQFHVQAAALYRHARDQRQKIFTTNYVIAELIALLSSPLRLPRTRIVSFIDNLKSSPYLEIVHVDSALDKQGWQLFKSRLDKEWSLVDCTSFVLMEQRGAQKALSTDHHFEQAGFVTLFK